MLHVADKTRDASNSVNALTAPPGIRQWSDPKRVNTEHKNLNEIHAKLLGNKSRVIYTLRFGRLLNDGKLNFWSN